MTDATYRLKLLGGLGLEGSRKVPGRVTQRRQLALLALLAGHDAPLTRDKLIGFLWPETAADRARHQLSDSLYIIRKGLGEDALIAPGDSIKLNTAIVGSDLADFRSALANEGYEDALAYYGGPFLDGFFPDGSEPFDRWMVDEREALKRQAARAAWSLVDRAEAADEVDDAVRWARQALKVVPENEQGVRRLIRLQDALGDRAGALRTYEEFAARLEAELDVEPSEETQRLISSIRKRGNTDHGRAVEGPANAPDSPVSTIEGPARRPPQLAMPQTEGQERRRLPRRGWIAGGLVAVAILATWLIAPLSQGGSSLTTPAVVAVLPFEIRGQDMEMWREGMVDAISTNLDVFSEVRAVPSRTVLASWRRTGEEGPGDLAGALQVAQETGASFAVTGSMIRTAQRLRIRSELYDVQTGDKLGEVNVEGAPDSIFVLVDRLSVAVMGPLLTSSSVEERWPRLASLTTSSPTALEAFLEGETLHRAGRYPAAIDLLKRAVEADSTFALAHYRLAEAYLWTTGGADSREHARLAARNADRLPEREARLLRAFHLWGEGRITEWLETLREAVRQHPDDPQAWHWLGEIYYHAGNQLLVPPWEFVDAFERSIALDPSFAPAYEHLIDAACQHVPDSARARALIERRMQAGAGDEEARDYYLTVFQLAFRGPHDRNQVLALLESSPLDLSSFDLRGIALHPLAHPRFLATREAVLRLALEGSDPNWEEVAKRFLFWTLLARGQIETAIDLSNDPKLDRDRATMLYKARAFGYPIARETLERAISDAPTGRDVRAASPPEDRPPIAPGIFERGAYAAEEADWTAHGRAKIDLRAVIPTIGPESSSDTLRVRGLIEALDGYAAWRRGDLQRALVLLRNAQVRTRGSGDMLRSIVTERNQIVRTWLGALLLEMDRPREALVYYESLGPGWPISQDPMIYFHLGRIQDRLGDPTGAAEAYELAAVAWQDPDPELKPLAQTARREAKRLSELSRK